MTTHVPDQYATSNKLHKSPANGNMAAETTRPVGTEPTTTTGGPQHHTPGGKTTSGPHKSDLMNKLDPRVDSKAHEYPRHHDVESTRGTAPGTTTTTGTPHGMGNGGITGTPEKTTTETTTTTTRHPAQPHGMENGGGTTGVPHTAAGGAPPFNSHQSPMERQAQPQGTFDHRPHPGATSGGAPPVGGGSVPHGTSAGAAEPTMHGAGATGTHHQTTAGPHRSNLANKLDPRVDSDFSGGHPTTTQSDRRYGGAGDGAGTGQAPVPSMINQGDPNVQSNGGLGHHHQAPPANGGIPGTHTGGPYPDTHHSVTGGTHGPTPGVGAANTQPVGPNPDYYAETNPATHHSTTGGGHGLGHGIKAAAAGVHGAGETLRGTFNSTVDRKFNDPSGAAKNEAVANQGMNEMDTGNFSNETRVREGAPPKRY